MYAFLHFTLDSELHFDTTRESMRDDKLDYCDHWLDCSVTLIGFYLMVFYLGIQTL